MKFSIQHLSEIPIEDAHGGSGSRQLLVKPEHVDSPFYEAVTKGFLPSGSIFDWHSHQDTDETFIVTKGNGKFYCEEKVTEYKEGNVITIGANLKHKIEAIGDDRTEGFFIRVKVK